MSLFSGHGTFSGDLNTGGNLSEFSFLEALFGLGEVTQMTQFFCSSSITPHDFLVKIG